MLTKRERDDVRKLATRAIVFALPFALFALAMVAVDPFDYFGVSAFGEPNSKEGTAQQLHSTLRKAVDFQRNPAPNVLFGDSLMNRIRAPQAQAATGEPYFNFAFGGGTLPELMDAFWFAAAHEKLSRVYIAAGFINFAVSQNMNRFPEATAMLDQPLLYLTNRIVIKSAIYTIREQLTGQSPQVGVPGASKEAFWKQQLGGSTEALYRRYKYQTEYVEGLREIAEYCAEHGIELTIVILPTHTDLQQRLFDFHLEDAYARFHEDMRSLGTVIDFNFANSFTRDAENFKDPYHVDDSSMLVEVLWGDEGDPELFRRYDRTFSGEPTLPSSEHDPSRVP